MRDGEVKRCGGSGSKERLNQGTTENIGFTVASLDADPAPLVVGWKCVLGRGDRGKTGGNTTLHRSGNQSLLEHRGPITHKRRNVTKQREVLSQIQKLFTVVGDLIRRERGHEVGLLPSHGISSGVCNRKVLMNA